MHIEIAAMVFFSTMPLVFAILATTLKNHPTLQWLFLFLCETSIFAGLAALTNFLHTEFDHPDLITVAQIAEGLIVAIGLTIFITAVYVFFILFRVVVGIYGIEEEILKKTK